MLKKSRCSLPRQPVRISTPPPCNNNVCLRIRMGMHVYFQQVRRSTAASSILRAENCTAYACPPLPPTLRPGRSCRLCRSSNCRPPRSRDPRRRHVYGDTDATGTNAKFKEPWGLAISGTQLYVADYSNSAIRVINTDVKCGAGDKHDPRLIEPGVGAVGVGGPGRALEAGEGRVHLGVLHCTQALFGI